MVRSRLFFTNRRQGGLSSPESIRTAFNTELRRSGLAAKGYRFHDIRRTFATWLYNRGVVMVKVQRLFGHKSVITTERYLGVKLEETREVIIKLDGVLPVHNVSTGGKRGVEIAQ